MLLRFMSASLLASNFIFLTSLKSEIIISINKTIIGSKSRVKCLRVADSGEDSAKQNPGDRHDSSDDISDL